MASKRDKFIALSKRGGGRKDYVKLAFEEGLTDKETPAPVKRDNLATKAFAKASSLDIEGERKTDIFKNLNKLNKAGKLTKAIPGVGIISSIFDADEANAAEVGMKKEDFDRLRGVNNSEEDITSEEGSFKKGGRVKKAKGGLIRGFPKIAKRGC
jgi:hypothetical protein